MPWQERAGDFLSMAGGDFMTCCAYWPMGVTRCASRTTLASKHHELGKRLCATGSYHHVYSCHSIRNLIRRMLHGNIYGTVHVDHLFAFVLLQSPSASGDICVI